MTDSSASGIYRFLPYELLKQQSADVPAQPQPTAHHLVELLRDDMRDGWITLVTAIILGTASFLCLSSAIIKFSYALTMTTQASVEVPELLTRQALSQIK